VASEAPAIRLAVWAEADLPLLVRLLGDPSMMEHLGGPETPGSIAQRHARYVSDPRRLFKIGVGTDDVGWVGSWERTWHDEEVFEMGWSVLPEHQGRGIASGAVRGVIEGPCAKEPAHRRVHAFPSVDNAPSNAVCARAGFVLVGPCRFEYPPGRWMECNDWRFDPPRAHEVAR
jgi:RimJ/RimL family protein N-acetyltransferase